MGRRQGQEICEDELAAQMPTAVWTENGDAKTRFDDHATRHLVVSLVCISVKSDSRKLYQESGSRTIPGPIVKPVTRNATDRWGVSRSVGE